jgi:chemotaxis protein CheX
MKKLNAKLLETAASTFENLGFMFADTVLEDGQVAAPMEVTGLVEFAGPRYGRLAVQMSRASADAVAANMLGQDQPPPEADMLDGLGEVVNVICGTLLPSVFGVEAVFNLTAPVVGFSVSKPESEQAPAAAVTLGLESGRARVALFIEE